MKKYSALREPDYLGGAMRHVLVYLQLESEIFVFIFVLLAG